MTTLTDYPSPERPLAPDRQELEEVFTQKFGPLETSGWIPRRWAEIGYFSPNEWYEALLGKLVKHGCRWLDVGCGRAMFPNPAFARQLADRCGRLVGVDPDDTAADNPYIHQWIRTPLEKLDTSEKFDLITLRMVAEHVTRPADLVHTLAGLMAPGGQVVIYTVNKWAPVSIVSALVPDSLHHVVKYRLWRTRERDTFPTAYLMNTRRALGQVFAANGFRESLFLKLADCKVFYRFRPLHNLELAGWRLWSAAGLTYPENCLLAVYKRLER